MKAGWLLLWLIPPLIAGAGFGLDKLVETDLEKIRALVHTVMEATECEDADTIEAVIAEDYRDRRHRTKSQLMQHCRRRLSQPVVENIITRIQGIKKSEAKATAIFTIRLVFESSSYMAQTYRKEVFVKVRFNLQKQANKRWLIERIEILEIDRRLTNWIDISNV